MATPIENNTEGLREILQMAQELPAASDVKLQEKTVSPTTAKQTVTPDSGYNGLSSVTVNAMPTATQATPSISVSTAGVITASATQTEGYVVAGTKTATQNLTTQAAQTITPGTSDKTIASGRYLTGTQTIKGDSNLVAENIKQGVSIFGVSGSFEGNAAPQVFTGSLAGRGTTFNEEINCGFQPDIVIIVPPDSYSEWDASYRNDMCVCLGDANVGETYSLRSPCGAVDGSLSSTYIFGCYLTKTENGFSLGSFLELSLTGEFVYSTETVIYAAIKF